MPSSPSTELYTLGKGVLYIAEFSGGTHGAFEDLGNAPMVQVGIAKEKLPHFSSRSGTKEKDKIVTVERSYLVNFDLDEISKQNLTRFVSGTRSGQHIQALTDAGVAKEYALRFVADNPEGDNARWEFHKGVLSARGEVNLIGEEWMNLPFVFEGLADRVNEASSPFFDIYQSTTTSTSSTASTTSTLSSTSSSTTTTTS